MYRLAFQERVPLIILISEMILDPASNWTQTFSEHPPPTQTVGPVIHNA